MPDVKDILAMMEDLTPEQRELVERASAFAHEKHEGHVRNSGEPYFVHLFETARELAELGMGPRTVAAGFLHDCIEDADVDPEEVRAAFGDEILFLIQGVTKLGHLKYQGAERHAESLRRLFVATSQDIRVLMIKLMDRLHNMKTLEHVRPDKRVRIAKETLEIYAPIADRLGMGRLKRELEDLAFAWVDPEEYAHMERLVKERGTDREDELRRCLEPLRRELTTNGIANFRTEYRIKGLYSLCKKLERKKYDIENIYDVLAIRIIVPSVADCYQTLGIIHSLWRPLPGKIKDYIAFPKPNGYQSLHTTVITDSVGVIELQIRTESMHREAQYGIASHLAYKQHGSAKVDREQTRQNRVWYQFLLPSILRGRGEDADRNIIQTSFHAAPEWLREIGETYSKDAPADERFVEGLKSDFFSHRVFVFTPQGDVIDLPIDSSPVDFAYAVHSDIGDHIAAAKVNGKFVSLGSQLKNGDIVQIETKPSAHPTQKWLDYAKTSLARRKIVSSLGRREKEEGAVT
ncbi:HD domain-containing protein [Patescibacteria group bacterium]|jgi:GTP pyrophosphokinase|nr:HD domain-containing protein [Patescibacteria group bacterium]